MLCTRPTLQHFCFWSCLWHAKSTLPKQKTSREPAASGPKAGKPKLQRGRHADRQKTAIVCRPRPTENCILSQNLLPNSTATATSLAVEAGRCKLLSELPFADIHAYMHACKHTCMHIYMPAYVYIYLCKHTHTCVYTCAYTVYIYIYVYMTIIVYPSI